MITSQDIALKIWKKGLRYWEVLPRYEIKRVDSYFVEVFIIFENYKKSIGKFYCKDIEILKSKVEEAINNFSELLESIEE